MTNEDYLGNGWRWSLLDRYKVKDGDAYLKLKGDEIIYRSGRGQKFRLRGTPYPILRLIALTHYSDQLTRFCEERVDGV